MSCSGTLAPVHKPLMAVGQVSDEGNDNWISGDTAHPTAKDEKHVRSNYTETPTGNTPSLPGVPPSSALPISSATAVVSILT